MIHLWVNLQFSELNRHPPRLWKYLHRLNESISFVFCFPWLRTSVAFKSSSLGVVVPANLSWSKCRFSCPHLNLPYLLRLPNPARTEFNNGFSSLLSPAADRISWTKSKSSLCWRSCSVAYFAKSGLHIRSRDSGGTLSKTFSNSATVVYVPIWRFCSNESSPSSSLLRNSCPPT